MSLSLHISLLHYSKNESGSNLKHDSFDYRIITRAFAIHLPWVLQALLALREEKLA
jgi:hypothetical protein